MRGRVATESVAASAALVAVVRTRRGSSLGEEWSDAEEAVLRAVYPQGGGRAVHRVLPDRTRSSIKNAAIRYGVVYVGPRASRKKPKPPSDAFLVTPVPRMDPEEAVDCLLLRAWRGPVTLGLLGARIGA